MNRYQKAIRYTKPLVKIDEKIAFLKEKMVTGGMYSVVDTSPEVLEVGPTFEPAPLGDFSDLNSFTWDSASQGDGTPGSLPDLSQLQTTDINGVTQPRLEMPQIETSDGSKYNGTPYAMAFSGSMALTGQSLGYINENGYNHVYQLNNVFGVSYNEFARKFAQAYQEGSFTQKTIYMWAGIDCLLGQCRGGAAYYPSGTSNVAPHASRVLYAYSLLIPVDGSGIPKGHPVMTDVGIRSQSIRVASVISRDGIGDPSYYPGVIKGMFESLKSAVGDIGMNIVNTLSDMENAIGDALESSGISDVSGPIADAVSGIIDGIGLLGSAQETLQKNAAEGNIIPAKPGEVRATIADGASGSASNPIQTKLSSSSMNALTDAVNNYNPTVDGSLKNYINKSTSSSSNLGLKGTHNNIQGVEIRGDDIVLKDTYGFGDSADIANKPIVKEVAGATEMVVNALGGNGAEWSKEVQTIFDQLGPVGSAAAGVASGGQTATLPGRKSPVVHFETVIKGGAKNMGSNFNVKESTLIEKWKSKNKKPMNQNNMESISKVLEALPKPIKRVLLFEVTSALEIAALPPDKKKYKEQEIKNRATNVYHDAYVDNQFPENVEQTSRVKKLLKRNLELSDPKTFKDPKPVITYGKLFGGDHKNKRVKIKEHGGKSPNRFLMKEKRKDTSRLRWLKS